MILLDAQPTWVIPEQLRRARQSLRLSVEEAAGTAGISVEELRHWEVGQVNPALPHLRRLSEIYRRPVRYFFVAEDPVPIIDYRLVPLEKRRILGPEGNAALIEFENLCRSCWELEQILEVPTSPAVERAQVSDDAGGVAKRVRESLEAAGLKTATPPASRLSARDVFIDYRKAIENLGVKVFTLRLPLEEARGASWWHYEYGPGILVSQSDWIAPRLFTLAHEYAHVALHEKGTPVCDMKGEADAERFANRFAAGLLVPPDAFWETLRRRDWTERSDWDDKTLAKLSTTFKVSRDVIAIRLEELRLVAPGFYRLKRNEWDKGESQPSWTPRGRRRPGWQIHVEDKLGPRYERLILSAYQEGHLTWADLTRYSGLRVREVEAWLDHRRLVQAPETPAG